MSKSLPIEYPIFTYNNQSVILKPGSQFTSNELRSRLHQMDVESININSKPTLVNLYESTLRNNQNKLKLFDRLKKDTEAYALKTGISFNQRMPMSSEKKEKEKKNTERSKVINLTYSTNVEPYQNNNQYEENSRRKQQIKLKRPINNNIQRSNNNINNAFFTSNDNYGQNNDDTYNEEEERNNTYNNNYYKNSRNFGNNQFGRSNYNNFADNININNNENYRRNNLGYNNNFNEFDNNKKMYTNEPKEDYLEYNETQNNKINPEKKKELDEQSTFSFFSGFSYLKPSKEICGHILLGLIIICSAFGLIFLYRMFSESINGFFSSLFNTIIHPGEIISSTFGFLMRYWYMIPIVLIFIIVAISLFKKYQLRKRCEEIIKKLVEDLSKQNDNKISEEDIYNRYVKGYGVSWKKFNKVYLPLLQKMRRKDSRLKIFSESIEGKNIVFWEYYQ